jgi:arylsulfatase A-like enzyme
MKQAFFCIFLSVSAIQMMWPCPLSAGELGAAPQKPNIIFILADDLGIDGVGCYGSDTYKTTTPNIDALAHSGIRFETCYSTPLCGPSRCLLLTGRYPFHTGGLTNTSWNEGGPGAVSKNEHPIARLLKERGYATCQTGKWRQIGETPKDWGFDEYCTDPTAAGWYWRKQYNKDGQIVRSAQEVYCPDIVHRFATDFIRRHQHHPFFIYYATHLVHLPMERTPDRKPGVHDEKTLYADNIAYMDKQVGEIVQELNRLKLREKTLIVFSGDNGTVGKFAAPIGGRMIHGSKGQMLEGGSRVPLIANWKGITPKGDVIKDLIDFSDIYPTFAEVAGAILSSRPHIDGHSFAPQLHGRPGQPRKWVYVQLGNQWYVRSHEFKLTKNGELFDMKDAPFVEKHIPTNSEDAAIRAGRESLRKVLESLNPGGGKHDSP